MSRAAHGVLDGRGGDSANAPRQPPTSGIRLVEVPEPVGLRHALRALAEEAPRRAAGLLVDPGGVAAHLWRRWFTPLRRAGLSEQEFLDILAGYQRELWHWLWGDRTWV